MLVLLSYDLVGRAFIRYTSLRSCRACALCIKIKRTIIVSKLPISSFHFYSHVLLGHKKRTNPEAHMSSKSVPQSAPPGFRTLDTLIKRDLVIQKRLDFS